MRLEFLKAKCRVDARELHLCPFKEWSRSRNSSESLFLGGPPPPPPPLFGLKGAPKGKPKRRRYRYPPTKPWPKDPSHGFSARTSRPAEMGGWWGGWACFLGWAPKWRFQRFKPFGVPLNTDTKQCETHLRPPVFDASSTGPARTCPVSDHWMPRPQAAYDVGTHVEVPWRLAGPQETTQGRPFLGQTSSGKTQASGDVFFFLAGAPSQPKEEDPRLRPKIYDPSEPAHGTLWDFMDGSALETLLRVSPNWSHRLCPMAI